MYDDSTLARADGVLGCLGLLGVVTAVIALVAFGAGALWFWLILGGFVGLGTVLRWLMRSQVRER
jgi:hypothetical protein